MCVWSIMWFHFRRRSSLYSRVSAASSRKSSRALLGEVVGGRPPLDGVEAIPPTVT